MSENVQTETPAPAPAPKITSVVKGESGAAPHTPGKVRDPKRVEQGKKLAAISKAAKERKARERLQAEVDEASWNINYGTVFGVVGSLVAVAVAVAAIYYASRTPSPTTPRHRDTHKP